MVCVSGFLRYDCACQIFADEVRFYSSDMEIFLAKRKNDQFRSGSLVCIARGKSLSCPVSLLNSLLVKAGALGKHISVFRSSGRVLLKSFAPQINPGLTPLLELALCKLWLILLTCPSHILTDRYGQHSLHSGGATLVAKEDVPDQIFQAHGAWRLQAMHAYIERPIAKYIASNQGHALLNHDCSLPW
jgi:hypothetical protein